MAIKIVNELPQETWCNFVKNHPQGSIFHTPEMFQVFSLTKGYVPRLWAAVDEQGQILALLLPVDVTVMSGLMHDLTTRSVLYGGLLVRPDELGQEGLAVLLETYCQKVRGQTLFTEIRHLSDATPLKPILDKQGFVYEDHLNYLVDLARPVEDILQAVGSRTRKRIRKAQRDESIQITEVTDRAELDNWYRTLETTYENAQVPLADRSLFEATFDQLLPKNMVRFTVAKIEGVTAACSVELLYKDTVYGWYGGSERDYSRYSPNEILTWHILEWSAQHNYRVYDFGGAGKPDEEYGVRDFKAKFGGELVCYGRSTYTHRPLILQLSQQGYKLYRRIRFR